MLLAIDTATQLTSIAVFDGRSIRYEQTWETAQNHGVELAPAIERAFELIGAGPEQLAAVAACTGPGTYTGLRIGVSLAKGMAAARGLPLVGLGTMEILAAGQPEQRGRLLTVVRAGRGRIIAASFQWRIDHWGLEVEPDISDWKSILDQVHGPTTVTGEIDDDGYDLIAKAQAKDVPVSVSPAPFRLRRAAVLAQQAWARLQEKREDFSPALVVPVYVKTKDTP
jgi:tRNA threonylcarbamoyladenosine biosynthesis protein TsaB